MLKFFLELQDRWTRGLRGELEFFWEKQLSIIKKVVESIGAKQNKLSLRDNLLFSNWLFASAVKQENIIHYDTLQSKL